jgi:hypothetical protein
MAKAKKKSSIQAATPLDARASKIEVGSLSIKKALRSLNLGKQNGGRAHIGENTNLLSLQFSGFMVRVRRVISI